MTQKSTKQRTKAPRRRIHRGRLTMLLSIVAAVGLLIMLCVARCSGAFDGDTLGAHVTEAIEAGRADAEKVVQTAPGSMERDAALLFIKARESRLRLAGHVRAADDYINSANEYLKSQHVIE